MKPNKETILAKTHYGLNIYAHILKQYYSGDAVLSLSSSPVRVSRTASKTTTNETK
jgi:hypothetical protein